MKHMISCLIVTLLILSAPLKAVTTDNETQNLHRFIWANYNQASGNLDESRKWYDEIFSSDKASIHTYRSYLYYLRDTNNFQRIVSLIPKLEAHTSLVDDPSIQLIFIQALEKAGQQKEAVERLIKVNDKYKGHQEIAFFTANLYLRRKEPKSALIVIDNFLRNCSHRPNNFIFYFLKGQILVQLDQVDRAIKQIKQCLEMHPNFEKGWLFYAMLEEKQGELDNAIKSYLTYLELTGGNREVERHLIQILLKQSMTKQQSKSISLDASVVKKAIILFEQKRYQEALEHLRENLNKKSDNSRKVQVKCDEYQQSLKCVEHKVNEIVYSDDINSVPSICLHSEL